MSKLGRRPISILEGVEVQMKDGILFFKGKEGAMELKVLPAIDVKIDEKEITLSLNQDFRQARINWGTMASLVRNAMTGVSQGFSKTLQMEGIGFRANLEGKTLVLSVGFSHPVKYDPPDNIKIIVEKNLIKVSGINKEVVGQAAAEIRKIKKPEPYLGKGIRYQGEVVRRKAGKKAITAAAGGGA